MFRRLCVRSFSTSSVSPSIEFLDQARLDPAEVAANRHSLLIREQRWLKSELTHFQEKLEQIKDNVNAKTSVEHVNSTAARYRVYLHHVADLNTRLTAMNSKVERSEAELKLRKEAQKLRKAMEASLAKQLEAAQKLEARTISRKTGKKSVTPKNRPQGNEADAKKENQPKRPLNPHMQVVQNALKEGLSLKEAHARFRTMTEAELEPLRIQFEKDQKEYAHSLSKPKRLNAFAFYVAQIHAAPEKSQEGEKVTQDKAFTLSQQRIRVAAERWRALSDQERQEYKVRAEETYAEAMRLWENR